MKTTPLSRRVFLRTAALVPTGLLLAACGGGAADATPTTRATDAPASATPTSAPASPTTSLPTETVVRPAATSTAPPPATAPPSAATSTVAAAAANPASPAAATALPPTPACGDDDDEPTVAQTEGPFYTPNTPRRTSLIEPGMTGAKLVLTGRVVSTTCQPVAGALLDFWQADDQGQYDNTGFRLRGHQFADDRGAYQLETILPAVYTGRTRHIHVKVQAPNRPALTTQLYFPNEPANRTDRIFHPDLVMAMRDGGDGARLGAFDFVLEVG